VQTAERNYLTQKLSEQAEAFEASEIKIKDQADREISDLRDSLRRSSEENSDLVQEIKRLRETVQAILNLGDA